MELYEQVTTVTAEIRLCSVCRVTPLTPLQKYCSGKCRVAAFRAKHTHTRVRVGTDYQRNRRSAVTGCTSGQTLLRDVGKDGDLRKLQEIESQCLAARKKLRADSAKVRKRLKREMKAERANYLRLSELRKVQLKVLGKTLREAIDKSDSEIRNQ